jgi:hypothetical protein
MRDLPKTSRPRATHSRHRPVVTQGRSPMVALTKRDSCRSGIGDQGVTRQSILKIAAPSEACPAAPRQVAVKAMPSNRSTISAPYPESVP